MKVSLSWLKDYVPVSMEPRVLADALTMAGLEVEAISDRYDYLEQVLVGRILDIASHPGADKLKLCQVDLGDRRISVVCGAPNISKDMLTPVALPGTCLPDGFTLEKSLIRGQLSEGMICSQGELGLGPDRSGVMVIGRQASVGAPLSKALNLSDPVFEIGLTPNRPDCLCIVGIAREVAALQKTRIKYPEIDFLESQGPISRMTSVTIEAPDLCPRYTAGLVENISVGPSPFWLRDKIMSVGLRSINNIVDITNFVMMELGQPLHAFDFDRLEENRIVVRAAAEGELFASLDQKERALTPDMLMICDGKKPVAIAGVMGGLNSEIEASTTRVLIESAYFSPVSIRKTSKKLGLNTEASHRFERGIDPEGTVFALKRAAQLMARISRGILIGGIIDEYPRKKSAAKISLKVKDANRCLGTRLSRSQVTTLLNAIEFKVEKDPNGDLTVLPPPFRVDIERPVDLMEEIARLSGYHKIRTTFPSMPSGARPVAGRFDFRERFKRLMTGFGFTETIHYSFVSDKSCDKLLLDPADPRRNLVKILNPLSEDQSAMRTCLIHGLLETMRRNIAQQNKNLKLFEVGNIYIGSGPEDLPQEVEMAAGLWTGARVSPGWHSPATACDFYDIKGLLEGIFQALNLAQVTFTTMPAELCRYTKAGFTAQVLSGNKPIGLAGQIHPQALLNYDLEQPAYIFELNLNELSAQIPAGQQIKPIPKFPSVSRDLTLIIEKSVESFQIIAYVKSLHEELVEEIYLFDVFEGNPVPAGKKSVSFRIIYRSYQETLEDETATRVHRKIAEKVMKKLDATLPPSQSQP
ncbi:MAG: phenylalanine--tRNA ligase subunit beta [Desulfobacterales bacterium]|nr:phenylalanine--tRNA ligase subunit beta [Desulfobacterales bacterium]